MESCFQAKSTLEAEPRPGEVARAVARAKQGDGAAIRFLHLRYAGNVYGYARSIVRNDQDAEDVVQQVFTSMVTAIHRYEQGKTPFSHWLMRITHNTAISQLRRPTPALEELEACGADGRDDIEAAALRTTIRAALAGLPIVQREVVVLRLLAGFSPGEIAARLGRSEASIHAHHRRGRQALRAALVQAGAKPSTLAA